MIALLDVNVLVALAWPNHVHHQAARFWFRSQQQEGWATCSVTESGFIRVSSNPRIIPEAKSPQEAALLLRSYTRLPNHTFWSDDVSLSEGKWMILEKVITHHQVTDAHLLMLALNRGGRLATFDRGISGLVPRDINPDNVLHLIPFSAR